MPIHIGTSDDGATLSTLTVALVSATAVAFSDADAVEIVASVVVVESSESTLGSVCSGALDMDSVVDRSVVDSGEGSGVGIGVGFGVGDAVGGGVGDSVGSGVGAGVGGGVGNGVGNRVGRGVGGFVGVSKRTSTQ